MNDPQLSEPAVPSQGAAVLHSARERASSACVRRWVPAVLTLNFLLTLAATLAAPDSARPQVMWAVTAGAVLGWTACIAHLLGLRATRALAMVVFASQPLMVWWAVATGNPGESLNALTIVVLLAAWLLGPRVTAAAGVMAAALVLGVWFVHGAWAHPQILPDAVFIVTTASIFAVVIARSVERAAMHAVAADAESALERQRLTGVRRRMVADVSHELRTPLTSINGFLDTVLRDDVDIDSDLARELIVAARRGGARLESLVDDLLDVERAANGTLVLERSDIAVADFLEQAREALPLVPSPRRLVVTSLDGQVATTHVDIDVRRLTQVFVNLVDNAVRYGSGDITIASRRDGAVVHIDVRDDGAGLPDDVVDHMFEPFTSFGEHRGATGIGLSIARNVTVAHGGDLNYVPRTDTAQHAFRITLPAATT